VRRLVINADDLGYDPEIDRGILLAHREGLVTSATAMVDTPFSGEALSAAPPSLGIGLHAVLDPAAPAAEAPAALRRQLLRFARLRGAPPTHLDSHRHLHARADLLPAFLEVAREQGLPLRALDAPMRDAVRRAGVATTDAFLGDADLRPCWTLARLLGALEGLPEGTVELMAHPGYRPSLARTRFGAEREVELEALRHPAARAALLRSGAMLVAWDAVAGPAPAGRFTGPG
jgi:predicted glycoside hydrolase/deacetylase ChbG (UPF0249 family)